MTARAQELPAGTGDCSTGKIAYANRKQAKASARRHGGPRRKGLQAYLCPECEAFHLGHSPAAVRNGEITKTDWLSRLPKETH